MFKTFKSAIANFMNNIKKAFDDSYNEYNCWDEWREYEMYSNTNFGLN